MDTVPAELNAILEKLAEDEKDKVLEYIAKLQNEINELKSEGKKEEQKTSESAAATDDVVKDEEEMNKNNEPPFPPLYSGSGEDFDKAGECKQQAADLKSAGDWEGALAKYTEAVLAAPPSALLYANRALVLLELGRPRAAENDCNAALEENPDSAKALRVRGKARKELKNYNGALQDLSAAQTIDFDPDAVPDLKFLAEKHQEQASREALERNAKQEKLKQRASEIKKAQKEAAASTSKPKGSRTTSARASGSTAMPEGAGGGAMPLNMADIMNDPELMAAMQNPKVMTAMQELMSGPGGPMAAMSNPAKLQQLMTDPDVGPVFQKLMSKIMSDGGAAATGASSASSPFSSTTGKGNNGDDVDDDIPDLEDLPDLD